MQKLELAQYIKMYNPLQTSHILVKTGGSIDAPTITQEQGQKLADVCKALEDGTEDFGFIAKAYSEDSGSAEKYGSLGLMDITTSYVNEYKYNTFMLANAYNGTSYDLSNFNSFNRLGKTNSALTLQGTTFTKANTAAADVAK